MYFEVVIADHRFSDAKALHRSHQGLIIDKPKKDDFELILKTNFTNHLMRKSSLAVESPAVWMNARRSVAAEAILAPEKSKNWRRIVFKIKCY